MIVLDLNKTFKDIDGSDLADQFMYSILANILKTTKSKFIEDTKCYEMCLELMSKKAVKLGKGEIDSLMNFLKNESTLLPFANAQLKIELINANLESIKEGA